MNITTIYHVNDASTIILVEYCGYTAYTQILITKEVAMSRVTHMQILPFSRVFGMAALSLAFSPLLVSGASAADPAPVVTPGFTLSVFTKPPTGSLKVDAWSPGSPFSGSNGVAATSATPAIPRYVGGLDVKSGALLPAVTDLASPDNQTE